MIVTMVLMKILEEGKVGIESRYKKKNVNKKNRK